MPDATDLDHLAIALPDRTPFWDVFSGDLGGEWVGGGATVGFASAQVRFAGGMKVEALEPHEPERNDFLVRFLAASGPGPHHLTYKVPDLEAAIGRARAGGWEPVGVDLSDPQWKEAFLHPKVAHGVVVQLAWSAGDWDEPAPAWLPAPRVANAAELVHVAHAVADLEGALQLWKGLLEGTSVDAGAGGGTGWVDLAWPGPGRLRLVSGAGVGDWVGSRPGRVHHVAFRVEDPAAVAGAVARDGWWEVPPTTAIGTRLVLVPPGAPVPLAV